MFKTTIDQHSSLTLSAEALEALGVRMGEEVEIQIVGHALVIRSAEEASRSRDFMSAFDSILSTRRTSYETSKWS